MTTRTRNNAPPALSAAERAALTDLEAQGWSIEYSRFLGRWTMQKGTWTTSPHETPEQACEAAQKLQEAAAATLEEQDRVREALRAYLRRGREG